MSDTNGGRPRVLIEDWLPVAELGIESRRESAPIPGQFPKLKTLHLWWARRPLVASAAVVLAGLLPEWSPGLAAEFSGYEDLQSERAYRRWFFRLIGILGDPIAARKMADAAKASGVKAAKNPYTYRPAFRNSPSAEDVQLLHAVLRRTWDEVPVVADPTAGGGSIPFVAARLGLPVYANDINGVAASVLKASVEIPARAGGSLALHVRRWGDVLVGRLAKRVEAFYPQGSREIVTNYIWANAIPCPRTGRVVPLMTEFWLNKDKGKEVAVALLTEADGEPLHSPHFEIVRGGAIDKASSSSGTIANGKAVSPYDHLVIDGDYIKAQAKAGAMTQVLYAVAIKKSDGSRTYRAPTDSDLVGVTESARYLREHEEEWVATGRMPGEAIPDVSNYERGHRMYGVNTWADMFSPRQRVLHATFVDEFVNLMPEVKAELGDAADDVLFLLGTMLGKGLNWNAKASSWDVSRQKTRSAFDKHNFSFKWTFAEFEGSHELYQWCLDQLVDAYTELASFFADSGSGDGLLWGGSGLDRQVNVSQTSATDLADVPSDSVTHLCMDPPYYDNVMYAELADFFYVWERHTLGRVVPTFFKSAETDKDNEAVANPARFVAMGKRKKELADLDYEAKMTAIFAECSRVLRDSGVMSVMFTHKKAEAWDTLGMGLLQAGFTVETSWPVNTESEQSLHQANTNSAASTIMLVCRKRKPDGQGKVFLDEIEAEIRAAARDSVERFSGYGLSGVDLLLASYGPALSVISSHWPVYSSEADLDGRSRLLRPEEALALAREEVVRMTRRRIIGQDLQVDRYSDFVLIAWATFRANEFSFDEARRLALSVGALDMDELARVKVLEKKSGTVRLLQPKERIRRGGDDSSSGVRIDATKFEYMNDALDTILYVAEVDGMSDAKAMMDRLGLSGDQRFLAYVQGLVNAMPRVKAKGEWIVPEAGLLDTLVTAYLPDITLPAEPEVVVEVQEAPTLFD